MDKLSTFLEFFINNATNLLTIITGVIGLILILYSIILIWRNDLLTEYKKRIKKIKSFEIIANKSKIGLYKKKNFFRLKNKGKDPCEMNKKIEIDDFYLSCNNSMYID